MAYTFPTLSVEPVYPLEEEREEGVIRSNSEYGKLYVRNRHNRSARRIWRVNYEYLPTTDKESLETLLTNTFCGAYTMTWTNPQSSTDIVVRFIEIPKFTYVINGYWNCGFSEKFSYY